MTDRRRHDSVSVEISAPPERVYDLVSDITRMGEWSPECRSCRWTGGASGPAVGARFKARNKGRRGMSWFNTPTVTVADSGREFAFNRKGPGARTTPLQPFRSQLLTEAPGRATVTSCPLEDGVVVVMVGNPPDALGFLETKL